MSGRAREEGEAGRCRRAGAGLLAVLLLLLAGLAIGPAAQAGEVVFAPQHEPPQDVDGWQAGTCNVPNCEPESPTPSVDFFETAAGHPPFGFTQFIVRHEGLFERPQVDIHNLRVDLPVGLSVNPGATPQCQLAAGQHPDATACEPAAAVGYSEITLSPSEILVPVTLPQIPVYNLVPKPGEPARFGFSVPNPSGEPSDIFLEADLAWDHDYHEGFTIDVPKPPVPGAMLLKNRLVFNGRAGREGFFLTTPSTCFDPTQPAFAHTYSTYARADSYENPDPAFPSGSPFVESPLQAGTSPKECATIPFDPSLAVDPGTKLVDSPAGATTEVKLPIEPDAAGQETATLRTAKVSLPVGMGLNPAAANGLAACANDQLGRGTRNPVSCPAASKVGTVALTTPALPEGPLTGNVYVGVQQSRDPQSGEEFRIFVDAESSRYGVSVRLIGNVAANAQTGQLTATFDEPAKMDPLRGELPHGLPQVPLGTFRLDFTGGSKAPLSSPPTCGPLTATSELTPWSAQFSGKPPATPSSGFSLASLPAGGPCPKTMAERPFAPSLTAQPKSDAALAFTPFSMRISRSDGEQELKGVDVVLPPGATAKLKGVRYCPPAAIAATAAHSGGEEQRNPGCPSDSRVGTATILAGTGSEPLKIEGEVYLAGRYRGAPLSLVVVTPALAGPFDLGTVVVRIPLRVDPETARIHPVTNEIPDVYGGTKLDIRSISVNVNRRDFALNGTSCAKSTTSGTILGGGADPTDPASFSPFAVSDPFQASGCKKLKFRPKLSLRLFGATHRTQHPRLRAVLKAKPGEANVGRASVALPHSLFLDQASLSKVCTRVQFAAERCPKKSVYGHARAFSPLLGKPLEGPVYLRSSTHTLPDLVAHLEGQVDIDLVGRVDSYRGGIRTTFDHVPDVPVSKFAMTLPGGKRGLLVASTNLCARPVIGIVRLKGQNGRKANRHVTLGTQCGGARKRRSSKHHHM